MTNLHRQSTRYVLAAVLVAASACGSSSGPTGPTAATIVSLAVTSSSTQVFLGASETFTITATKSDGTTSVISGGTWSGDSAAVASVGASTGTVTGLSSGAVTVSVTAQGMSAAKFINVRPNYQGIWLGTNVVNACAQSGGWTTRNLCGSSMAPGSVLRHSFNFTQLQNTLLGQTAIDQLSATMFVVASMNVTIIQDNGSVAVQATAVSTTTSVAQAFALNMTQSGHIKGTLVETWTDTTTTGQMVVTCTLNDTTLLNAAGRFAANLR